MAQLIIENLVKAFPHGSGNSTRAVDRVALSIAEHELLALVGPSGSGKTTLLRLIAGLEEPDEGTISIEGSVLTHVPASERDVAMVFQNYALYPHMSVYENLAFGLKLRKVARAEIKRRVEHVAEMVGVNGLLDRDPQTLSGGERQRVALGRALTRQPKILLLDEPLSGLDPRLRRQMRHDIAGLQKRLGLTMLYVTHDQTEAMSLGHRVAVLNRGVIEQIDEPSRIYAKPANRFVAEFFGTPPMNFFSGGIIGSANELRFEHRAKSYGLPSNKAASQRRLTNDSDTDFIAFSAKLSEADVKDMRRCLQKEVILGIRPEQIYVCTKASGPHPQLEAPLETIERLGAENYLYFLIGNNHCVARIGVNEEFEPNRRYGLCLEMNRAHFFEPDTGRRINS